jgi:2-polyprenyl-3-methyl-5-hydroxy-6-metoxy-1,4-benzoquinol methylase
MEKEREVISEGVVYRFSSGWTHKLESEQHWRLYWRQQKIMEGRVEVGDTILEIGVGTGFTASYLRARGISVTTVDIDKNKKPDIVANVVTFRPTKAFNHILAFEVFEHLPFDRFEQVVQNLAVACMHEGHLFMSLPQYRRIVASVRFKLPKLGKRAFTLTIPKKRLTEQHHFWELGYQDATEQRVIDILSRNGFQLVHTEEAIPISFFVFRKTSVLSNVI